MKNSRFQVNHFNGENACRKVILSLLIALLVLCGTQALADEQVNAGDALTFGHYPQTSDGTDNTPIEWLVLDVQDGKAFLLSRYALDAQPYNTTRPDVTWETSSLRAWLNNEFLNAAFTADEQNAILLTDVNNGDSKHYSQWQGKGGNNTQDKVYLLSYSEAHNYLKVSASEKSGSQKNKTSRAAATAYAQAQGVYTSGQVRQMDGYTSAPTKDRTEDGEEACYWWLRSPGTIQINGARVNLNGSLGSEELTKTDQGVRPVLWIDLSAWEQLQN